LEADAIPVIYFHVVFTLPAEIADIAFQNKALVYDLLFKAASETMLTIAADPRHLGTRIGVTAVLHTWGSVMTHHPHVPVAESDQPAEPDDFRPPCSCCGGRMIVIEVFERWRQPRGPPPATTMNRDKPCFEGQQVNCAVDVYRRYLLFGG
jgi:hypothetical protein